jgi:hypothetical protein
MLAVVFYIWRKFMMKKLISIIVAGICVCVSVSAQYGYSDSWLSVGGGITTTLAFKNGVEGSYSSEDGQTVNANMDLTMADVGITAFVDLKYALFMLGTSFYSKMSFSTNIPGYNTFDNYNSADIGFFCKLPIRDSYSQMSFYPMLGGIYKFVYKVTNTYLDEKSKAPANFNMFWFSLGFGAEYDFTPAIYVKMQLLYGIRPPNRHENNLKAGIKNMPDGIADSKFNQGVLAQILIGHKL